MNTHVPASKRRRHDDLVAHIAALSTDPANANEQANSEIALAKMRVRWPGLAPDTSAPDISDAATWRDAVEDIIGHWTRAGRCFSAGEIAKVIRDNRRDLVLSVQTLTSFVGSAFITYAGIQAVEVDRVTTGKHRTPAGLTVTVYAPSWDLGLAHDFEVEIPRPGPRALGAGAAGLAVQR